MYSHNLMNVKCILKIPCDKYCVLPASWTMWHEQKYIRYKRIRYNAAVVIIQAKKWVKSLVSSVLEVDE